MNHLFLLLALAWLAVATVLFCLPGSLLPAAGWMAAVYFDKWVHAGIFLLLYLFWKGARVMRASYKESGLLVALFVYGCLIEWVQEQFVRNRSFDVWDIAADGAGALLGAFLARRKKNKPL